jgi:hypothetical protein
MKTTTLFLMLAISLHSFGQFHITDSSHTFKIGEVANIGNTGASVALTKKVTDKSVYTLLYKTYGVADLYVNFTATKAEIDSLYNLLYSMLSQPANSVKTVACKLSVFHLEASNSKAGGCLVNINGAKFTLTKKELKTLFGK